MLSDHDAPVSVNRQGSRHSVRADYDDFDALPVSNLIEDFAVGRGWDAEMVERDLNALRAAHIKLVGDLRVLSPHSWRSLGVGMVCRDLLRHNLGLPPLE